MCFYGNSTGSGSQLSDVVEGATRASPDSCRRAARGRSINLLDFDAFVTSALGCALHGETHEADGQRRARGFDRRPAPHDTPAADAPAPRAGERRLIRTMLRPYRSWILLVVAMMPDGYQTMVGERGSTLSGGQRQRIGIARAIVRNAPILILDEPTAALDTETEKLVMDALEKLMQGRTVITIAHRLSTIRDADVILVLKEGVVAEQGTHDALLARGGIYADLYRTQAGSAAPPHDPAPH